MSSHSHKHRQSSPAAHAGNPDTDFIRRTDEKNKEYQRAYKEWISKQPPQEREKLEKLGLSTPVENQYRVSGHSPDQDRDAAESTQSRTEFDPGSIDDSPALAGSSVMSPEVMQVITRIVGTIIAHENVKIATAALAFALNMDGLNGLGSIREYAASIGVSPEAISKAKRKWESELQLPPNAFAKTDKAKAALSLAQRTKHWKKAHWKAPKRSTHITEALP
jgi:hypothetical protein